MALQKVLYISGKTIIEADNLNDIQDAIIALEKKTIPESTSDLTNDSGFITNAVSDLANYFLKSETYSRDEINQKISAIPKFSIQVVSSLPTSGISATTVYLLKTGDESNNLYTEYIYVNGVWEYLGTQTVDLSGYALTTDIPTKLSELTNDAGFIKNTVSNLTNYYKKTEVYSRSESEARYQPKGDYLTEIPSEYVTDDELSKKGFLTQHQDLSGYAKKATTLAGYGITDGATTTDVSNLSKEIVDLKTSIPSVPVQSVNGKTGAVELTADDVGATTEGWVQNKINELKAQGFQQTPLYANSIAECTDTSKMYVLPDGFIYAYMETEIEAEPTYTNLLPLATDASGAVYNGTGYKNGYRLNSSATEKEQSGCGHTGFIPAKAGDTFRFKNISACQIGYGYIHYFKSDKATAATAALNIAANTFTTDKNGVSSYTLPSGNLTNYIRFSYGTFSEDSIITINEEITESGGTTIGYAWVNTGLAFAPADYEDRILELEEASENHTKKLEELEVRTESTLMYISPTGSDSNDGLTVNTPKKTVKACVNAGATRISAKRGVYKEFVTLYNLGELEIFPTDNGLTYAVGEEREPIVFDTSDTLEVSSLSTYNSIKRVAYSNSANTQFSKVFTAQSQPPVVSEYGSRYNATVWLLSSDEKTVCIKLKPVLTVAECEAETNTFAYVSGYIYINANMTGVDKIVIPTNWETGFYVNGAERLVLKELEVRFSGTYNIDIRNCAYFDFYKCACKYTSYGSGFHPFNSNGVMKACYATKNYDGYGISGYGHTTYIDCVSEFNFDDGMSHHDGTSGTVIGGRYEGNGKGGNTPAYGAKVNIYGGLYKDNASFGIGYLWASGLEPASGIVQGAVIVDNPIGLSVNANCNVTMLSCVLKDNTKERDIKGNLTEYGTVTN